MRAADRGRRAVSAILDQQRTPASAAPDYQSLQEAAEWFAVLRGDDVTPADRHSWQQWLAASPAHAAAWRRIEAVNQQFGQLPGPQARDTLATGRWQKRQTAKKLALLCAGVMAGGALLTRPQSRQLLATLGASERTATGAMRQLALADGSQLWLNTATAADLDYTGTERRIALHDGELLLTSAPDPVQQPRPLLVDVPQGRLRALGTRFSVRRDGDTTRVAVFDGAVRVEPGNAAPRVVTAGFQLRFGADWIDTATPADANAAAWTEGRLVADGMRLDDFVAELARYRHGHLGCAPDVAHLRLTGSYPLADTGRILASLAATLPVRVRQVLPWWVTLEAA